ncbi:hypothetical protein V7147_25080 [Bacillus sp. JJ1521]|uniref:hypothetical protein n=1 Tax=Bacillus sp. JJ1521 TaxID=3122957 RepID=UPI002FFF754A
MHVEKIIELKEVIYKTGNSNLAQLKNDNFSILSKNLTIFGPKTNKWGKVFIKNSRIEIVIDLPSFHFSTEDIAEALKINLVERNTKKSGFRINQQKDRDQLIIYIYQSDFSKISLTNEHFTSFISSNSKLVCI